MKGRLSRGTVRKSGALPVEAVGSAVLGEAPVAGV